jgi:hypothetical protein
LQVEILKRLAVSLEKPGKPRRRLRYNFAGVRIKKKSGWLAPEGLAG